MLNDNKLQKLPDEFCNLILITNIFLSNNALTELPESIGNLGNVKFLHLSRNQLKDLPVSVDKMFHLAAIELDENPIERFSPDLSHIQSLRLLTISNKQINKKCLIEIKNRLPKKCILSG